MKTMDRLLLEAQPVVADFSVGQEKCMVKPLENFLKNHANPGRT